MGDVSGSADLTTDDLEAGEVPRPSGAAEPTADDLGKSNNENAVEAEEKPSDPSWLTPHADPIREDSDDGLLG